MKSKKYVFKQASPEPPAQGAPGGPYDQHKPLKVSFGFYALSLIVIAVAVFILVLVQYYPGYRSNYRFSKVVKNSDVELTVKIPMSEVENREPNPFTKKQRDAVQKLLKGMGARSSVVEIIPEEPENRKKK